MKNKGFLFRRKIVPEQSEGFTLVELLVVISIVALLTVIGLVLYSASLKQGRDSKRQADLKSIQLALEQYAADQGYYPQRSADCTNGFLSFNSGCAFKAPAGDKTYLNQVPLDPSADSQYSYIAKPNDCDNSEVSTNKCTSYCLYAQLESPLTIIIPRDCDGTANNFVVTPP